LTAVVKNRDHIEDKNMGMEERKKKGLENRKETEKRENLI